MDKDGEFLHIGDEELPATKENIDKFWDQTDFVSKRQTASYSFDSVTQEHSANPAGFSPGEFFKILRWFVKKELEFAFKNMVRRKQWLDRNNYDLSKTFKY